MKKYIAKRLLQLIPILIGITFLSYGMMRLAGSSPYKAIAVSDTEVTLVPNENYWGGEPKVDRILVKSITDGDTLTMGLQSGEIDATYGLPYASYTLFRSEGYHISACATSRVFFAQMNFNTPALQDANVRQAIAMGINKEDFVAVLLNGQGAAAVGAFPDSFPFGNETVTAPGYDPEEARALLAESGCTALSIPTSGRRWQSGCSRFSWMTMPFSSFLICKWALCPKPMWLGLRPIPATITKSPWIWISCKYRKEIPCGAGFAL